MRAAAGRPIVWLLALLLVAGLFAYKDYGLTWDEPLFYKYGDALGYAYTPANWFGGHFDLNESYGPSGDDHKTRGPGYLLLAREPVHLLGLFNVDQVAAWHLSNFLTFLVGVYFVYRLSMLFAGPWASTAAAALFALQPLLWGHAFINPKDIPFLVFFSGSVWLGFRMVDRLADQDHLSRTAAAGTVLLAAFFLGIATSNRVLGPLAGILVAVYYVARGPSRRTVTWMVVYAFLAVLITLASWPYLWESPFRFLDVFRLMSDNPTVLQVLFADQIYHAYDLPRRYLPFYLATTLTEVVWPLFLIGLAVVVISLRQRRQKLMAAALILAWFLVPLAYDIVRRPPIYDGMRHFLFILPPVFVFAGAALEFIFGKGRRSWLNATLTAALLAPGALAIIAMHPYQYTYYNSFVGGTGGAFRHYETDYWLTCYKEAVERFDRLEQTPVKLFVHREADVAQPYAGPNASVLDERGAIASIQSGDFVLVNTRTNEDRQTFRDAPVLLTVGRAGATFCVIKSIP